MESVYQLHDQQMDRGSLKSQIRIRWPHPLFEGHFPEQPVVPGVLMLSMLKDALNCLTGRKIQLSYATFIKFVNIWNPAMCQSASLMVIYDVEDDLIQVRKAEIEHDGQSFFKFKGRFDVGD